MSKWLSFTSDEFMKLMLQKKNRVMMALLLVYGVLISLLYVWLKQKLGLAILDNQSFSLAAVNLLMGLVLPVFTLSIGTDLIMSEVKDNTLKNILGLPISREKIYLGKLVAGLGLLGCLLVVVLVPTMIGSFITLGLGVFTTLVPSILGYIGIWIFLGLILLLANTIALLVGSPGTGMLLNMVCWFGMGTVGLMFYDINRYLPTNFSDWYKPFIYGGPYTNAIPVLLFLVCYYIILTILGMMKFQQKEV